VRLVIFKSEKARRKLLKKSKWGCAGTAYLNLSKNKRRVKSKW
jgi:hypothetical protein